MGHCHYDFHLKSIDKEDSVQVQQQACYQTCILATAFMLIGACINLRASSTAFKLPYGWSYTEDHKLTEDIYLIV